MSFVHALLLFVGGPAIVLALFWLVAVATSRDTESHGLYKPGDRWDNPLWFVGQPREGVSAHHAVLSIEAGPQATPSATMVGGASGNW